MSDRAKWRRRGLWIAPLWVFAPLMTLGLLFLMGKPFGFADDWLFYGFALVFAAVSGWLAHRLIRVTVVEHTESGVVVRYTYRARREDRAPT